MFFSINFCVRRPVLLSGVFLFFVYAHPVFAQNSAPVDLSVAPYQSSADAPPVENQPLAGVPVVTQAVEAPLDDTARLQNDLRDVVGQLERQQFEFNQLKTSLEKQLADLQLRLTALETKGASAAVPSSDTPALAATTPPAPETPMPSSGDVSPSTSPTVQTMGAIQPKPAPGVLAGVPNDPAAAYEESFTALKAADYAAAEQGFKAFLAAYPKHSLATNAKYWLGETYFARKDYAQSSRIFAEGYKNAPKGPKAADNLLKLGLSLAGQSKTKEACVALTQVGKDFPKGSSATLSRAEAEIKRLNCAP